ncbi:MAG: NAD(P)/FAD-dependent oxidoreductase [Crocinitomicaceae bacterium]|nr:NAD(P)/FAD-dependent oxidoreductase [Crocinitomicaceae bacterium]
MQNDPKQVDCIIIGGGLAGLTLAIQLAKNKRSVLLMEKNSYPFQKVCGEYISMESWDFLESLGANLGELNLPKINQLRVSAHAGFAIESELEMGGFGIRRYTLDHRLAELARETGVEVLENCTALDVELTNGIYSVKATKGTFNATIVCGSYGKIDPSFVERKGHGKGKYIGVKYHIKRSFPDDLIELHNFKNGYCGISKVDDEQYCLCYLTTTKNLNENGNNIKQMEQNVLMKNPFLRTYFSESEFVNEKPIAISQIGFRKKTTCQNHVILLGDAAGAIAPLCGNGMSIAMRSSKILAAHLDDFFTQTITKQELIDRYTKDWNGNFSFRIKTGFYLQKLFGKRLTTLWMLKLLNKTPKLLRKIVRMTHGEKF